MIPLFVAAVKANSEERLLERVLAFLSTYAWVYSFKWTELLTLSSNSTTACNIGEGYFDCDPLVNFPSDWNAAISRTSIADLQVIKLPTTYL